MPGEVLLALKLCACKFNEARMPSSSYVHCSAHVPCRVKARKPLSVSARKTRVR